MRCDICGVDQTEKTIKRIKGMCLCPKHITQYYRYGHFIEKTIYDPNDYVLFDDHAEIILRDRFTNEVGRAIIDKEDVSKCKEHKWHLRKGRNTDYAIATIGEKEKIHLHRLILDYDGPDDIDHIDRNGLNNRKENLRILSHADNLRNQSEKRKGIKKVPSGNYQAVITKEGKGIYLGTFPTYYEALEARHTAEQNI